jgi:hypothetical protein
MDKERAIEVFVAETLKEYIEYHLENRELLDEDKEILISLLRVVEYMSLRGDYNTYYENKKDKIDIALGTGKIAANSFTVTHINENEDGSANIEVEMGTEMRSKLLDEGLNFLLVKAALGGTTSDILTWATAGKC